MEFIVRVETRLASKRLEIQEVAKVSAKRPESVPRNWALRPLMVRPC